MLKESIGKTLQLSFAPNLAMSLRMVGFTLLVSTYKRYWLNKPIVLQDVRSRHVNNCASADAHCSGF